MKYEIKVCADYRLSTASVFLGFGGMILFFSHLSGFLKILEGFLLQEGLLMHLDIIQKMSQIMMSDCELFSESMLTL